MPYMHVAQSVQAQDKIAQRFAIVSYYLGYLLGLIDKMGCCVICASICSQISLPILLKMELQEHNQLIPEAQKPHHPSLRGEFQIIRLLL